MRLIILFLCVSLTGYGQSLIKVDAKKRTFADHIVGVMEVSSSTVYDERVQNDNN